MKKPLSKPAKVLACLALVMPSACRTVEPPPDESDRPPSFSGEPSDPASAYQEQPNGRSSDRPRVVVYDGDESDSRPLGSLPEPLRGGWDSPLDEDLPSTGLEVVGIGR